jgi:hypothetical protein
MTTTTKPASDPQLKFIHGLLEKRDVPVAGTTLDEAWIIARIEDVMGQKDIASHEASRVIDYLKGRPTKNQPQKGSLSVLKALPAFKYGVRRKDGSVAFYEVTNTKGYVRIKRLYGHPGDWRRQAMPFPQALHIAAEISKNPIAAAELFGDTFQVCGRCLSPLSDPVSLKLKMGPHCRKSFSF